VRVNFVTTGGSHLASYRLRIGLPKAALERMGVKVSVGDYDPSADAHVFSKHWAKKDQEFKQALESPCPIYDICDDWFNREHDEHYRRMCRVCDVVVSSDGLGDIVFRETGKVATTIPEPYELPDGTPKEPGPNPRILWFGHSGNLPTLHKLKVPNLFLCTNGSGKNVVPWSEKNLRSCLEFCDFVIIPQVKEWKSANRMVESLRSGRFVVASDIPSYRGFSQYLGDIEDGVEWVRSQPAGAITERIISGRKELRSFSPERIGQKWYDCISAAVANDSGDISISTPTAGTYSAM
jgi:hypothetical protein